MSDNDFDSHRYWEEIRREQREREAQEAAQRADQVKHRWKIDELQREFTEKIEGRPPVLPGRMRHGRHERDLFSKALFFTIPLAVLILFLPPNGPNVEIPLGVHEFLAVIVASLGSPFLRRAATWVLAFAITLVVLVQFIP